MRPVGSLDTPVHPEAIGNGPELADEFILVQIEAGKIPFDAHEEQAPLGILMLIRMQDVGIMPIQKLADSGDDPFTVAAVDQKDGSVFHAAITRTSNGWKARKPADNCDIAQSIGRLGLGRREY